MTAQQWQQLNDSLRDHPDRDAEVARISAYMAYQADLQRYRDLRSQPGGNSAGTEAVQLAITLDAGLDTRLQRNEISAQEAVLIKGALLETLESDAQRRKLMLDEWRARTQTAQASQAAQNPQHSGADVREALYKQQESALVAAWNAQPEYQRDPKQLEAQLDALRKKIFDQP
jgi:hypothetical protein